MSCDTHLWRREKPPGISFFNTEATARNKREAAMTRARLERIFERARLRESGGAGGGAENAEIARIVAIEASGGAGEQ